MAILYSFFFKRCGLNRDLHSFPTRRSSDLWRVQLWAAKLKNPNDDADIGVVIISTDDRSEEHTSELQSHVNLVCRLLLEKKNSGQSDNSTTYSSHTA